MSEQTKLKIAVLIVLYNKCLTECSTFLTLLKNTGIENIDLLIWDNSEISVLKTNQVLTRMYQSDFKSLRLFGEGKNVSLSVVYNQLCCQAFDFMNTDLVILFDHDTEVPTHYVKTLSSEYINTEGDTLIVPKVRSKLHQRLISPRRQSTYYCFKRYQLNCDFEGSNSGLHSSYNLFAVASGLAVPIHVWRNGVRFEEKLRFYGIDTEFCADYSVLFKEFYLSEALLIHDISEETTEPPALKAWRFEQHMDYWRFQLQKHAPYPKWFTAIFVESYRKLYRLKLRLQRHA